MLRYIYYKTLTPVAKSLCTRWIYPLFKQQGSPHSIALGLAVGLWISLTPTVGLQMTMSVIACTVLHANIVVAVAMCWISNPVTFIPMYYGYYRLGLAVTHAAPTPWREFQKILQNEPSFWDQSMTLLALGFKTVAVPMWLGSLIIATALAIPSYFITYHALIRVRKSKAQLRAIVDAGAGNKRA